MCGLFGGISSSFSKREIEYIMHLGVVSSLRGSDSTGLFTYTHGRKRPKGTLVKECFASGEFLMNPPGYNLLNQNGTWMVMGHCRSATIGAVTAENAHPFKVEHIIGCHNGTVPDFKPQDPAKSDSAVLFEKLATIGLEDTITEAKHGAYALTWVNEQEATLNFLRNSERPLWFSAGGGSLFWASEPEFLDFARKRCGLLYLETPVSLDTHRLVMIDLNEYQVRPVVFPMAPRPTVLEKLKETVELAAKEIVGSALIPFKDTPKEEKKPPKQSAIKIQSKKGEKDVVIHALYSAFEETKLGVTYAHRLLQKGCSNCSTPNSLEDKSWWFSRTDYVCDECHSCSQVKEWLGSHPLYPSSIIGDLALELATEKNSIIN